MLALIAGKGLLPAHVAAALGEPPLVVAVFGCEPEGLTPELEFSLEKIASLLGALKDRGVTDVCFAGAVERPGFDAARVEKASLPFVERIVAAGQKGDDGALRVLLGIFEDAGFTIRAAQEIAPDLLPPPGAPTKSKPTRDEDVDVARAEAAHIALGTADIGQSCVVQFGQVVAVEAKPGTDWMLSSLAGGEARGGLFYKAPKPGQDRRIDLPAIGPGTVEHAAAAGLRGIVIEAGGVMVLEFSRAIELADAAGLFIWVRRQ